MRRLFLREDLERFGPPASAPGSHFPPKIRHPEDGEERIIIGDIVAAYGLRGEVKVIPQTDFPERFATMETARVRYPDGSERLFPIEHLRWQRRHLVVKLKGCETRSDAELLRGLSWVVRESEQVPLPEGVYYIHQILGLQVRTTDGESLGRVQEVMRTGSNDVLVTPRALIPALEDIVVKVDLEAGEIWVEKVEGLLDEPLAP